MRSANQIPTLRKLKSGMDGQWEGSCKDCFHSHHDVEGLGPQTHRKLLGQPPGLTRESQWAGREWGREERRGPEPEP